jgi:hypothetical protein
MGDGGAEDGSEHVLYVDWTAVDDWAQGLGNQSEVDSRNGSGRLNAIEVRVPRPASSVFAAVVSRQVYAQDQTQEFRYRHRCCA